MTTSTRNAFDATDRCFNRRTGNPSTSRLSTRYFAASPPTQTPSLPRTSRSRSAPTFCVTLRFAAGRKGRAFATPGRYLARSQTATYGVTPYKSTFELRRMSDGLSYTQRRRNGPFQRCYLNEGLGHGFLSYLGRPLRGLGKRYTTYPGLRDVRCTHVTAPWADLGPPLRDFAQSIHSRMTEV